jgi:hypothetical protein
MACSKFAPLLSRARIRSTKRARAAGGTGSWAARAAKRCSRRRAAAAGWAGEGAFDFEPLDGDAGLAAGREGRVAIGGRAAVDVAGERDGQAEGAVFKGLVFAEMDDGFELPGDGRNVHDAARGADVAGDIGAGGFTGAEGHRDGLRSGGEGVAG